MAEKTRQQLLDYANTYIVTNGTQAITGALMNTMEVDEIDSFAMITEVYHPTSIRVSADYIQRDDLDEVIISYNDDPSTPIAITLGSPSLTWKKRKLRIISNKYAAVISGFINDQHTSIELGEGEWVDLLITSGDTDTEWTIIGGGSTKITNGSGVLANQASQVITATPSWTEIPFGNPVTGTLKNVTHTGSGRLKVDFTDRPVGDEVALSITATAALEIPDLNSSMWFCIGINGTIISEADLVAVGAASGGRDSDGLYWPFSFSYNGVVSNGDEISLFAKYSGASDFTVQSASFKIITKI